MGIITSLSLLWVLCVGLAVAFAACLRTVRRNLGARRGVCAALGVLAVATCVLARKSSNIGVDEYLKNEGSYATNDTLRVSLSVASSVMPSDFDINVFYRDYQSTNAADWALLAPSPVAWSAYTATTNAGVRYHDYTITGATNYDFLVMSDFVPEPTVHTNGVWMARGFEIPGESGRFAFPNSRVQTTGYTARDYVQDGLIAMWDGIENAGWGKHDANATNWVDLIGGADMALAIPAAYTNVAFLTWEEGALHYSDSLNVANFPVIYFATVTVNEDLAYFLNVDFGTAEVVSRRNADSFIDNREYSLFGYLNRTLGFYGPILANENQLFRGDGYLRVKKTLAATKAQQYVNGEKMTRYNLTLTQKANSYSVGSTFRGFMLRGNYNCPSIDYYCIRLYNRALTAEEVAHNYEIDKARFNMP